MYGTGEDALIGIYGPYVITIDPATGTPIEIVDEYDSELVGIAVCYGNYYEDDGQSNVAVYVTDSAGNLYQEVYCYIAGYYTVPYYYSMFELRMSIETGINVGEAWYWNSLHYDAENSMIFWSAFEPDVDDNVTLYVIDEMNDFAVFNLGQFADGVWPVAGLYQSVAPAAAEANALNLEELKAAVEGMTIEQKHYEVEKIGFVKQEVNKSELPAQPMNGAILDTEKDTMTVGISAKDVNGEDVATTNGVITVTFDPAAQTLRNVIVHGDYYSVVEAAGSVTFSYVQVDGLDPNDVVATLVFDVIDEASAGVNVEYKEINDSYGLNTKQEVEVSTLMQTLAALEDAIAAGDKALDDKIAAVNAALQEAILAYQAADASLKSELSAQIASASASLRSMISQVSNDLEQAQKDLTDAMNAGDKALDDKIAALNTALENAIAASNASNDALNVELEEAVAALNAAVAAGDKALGDKIAALEAAIAASNAADEALRAELNQSIEDAVSALNAAIAQVQKNLDDAKAELNAKNDQLVAKDDALAAKDAQLNKLVVVAIVIASIGVCGCVALLVFMIVDKRKKV